MRSRFNFIDTIAKFIVFLNFTNLYTLLSGLTGVPFRLVGISFIGLLAFYLFLNREIIAKASTRPEVWLFIVLFIIIPTLSTIIAPIFLLSFAGYQILAGCVFLAVLVWVLKDGYENFTRWVFGSFVIGIVGILLSYLQPGLFERVAYMQAAASPLGVVEYETITVATERQGRAFGFYMQPNRASFVIALHLVILVFVGFHSRVKTRLAILAVALFAILLTGSRGGFVYIGLIAAMLAFFELKNGVRIKGRVFGGGRSIPAYLFFGLLGLGFVGLASYVDFSRNPERSAVMRVLNTFFSSQNESLVYDPSIEGRLIAQVDYIHAIGRSPILGHGLGASALDKYMGNLFLSSHNNILETAYNYGVPMTIAMYAYLFWLAFNRGSRAMKDYFRLNYSVATFAFILASSLVTNVVFEYRAFPTVMGFWVAMLVFKDFRGLHPKRL